MTRPLAATACLALALIAWPSWTNAADVRYFGVWSYTVNAPRGELSESALTDRDLGYWELEFDGEGRVNAGTYRGKSGARWLSLRYVEVDGRIYADLHAADGSFVKRKSTPLASREPSWANGVEP